MRYIKTEKRFCPIYMRERLRNRKRFFCQAQGIYRRNRVLLWNTYRKIGSLNEAVHTKGQKSNGYFYEGSNHPPKHGYGERRDIYDRDIYRISDEILLNEFIFDEIGE